MKRQKTGSLPASRLGLLGLAAALPAGGSPTATASPSGSRTRLTVTSTLDGHTTLPHRIHWQAFPSAPAVGISGADYLIGGRHRSAEHNTPYFYADDGNDLVTSFLTPGKQTFTVRAVTIGGQAATDTVTATAARRPPVAPADPERDLANSPAPDSPPSGAWRLVISPVGWQAYHTPAAVACPTRPTWPPGWPRPAPAWPWLRPRSPEHRRQRLAQGRAGLAGPRPVLRSRRQGSVHFSGQPAGLLRVHHLP
jgi:hypothetical protein